MKSYYISYIYKDGYGHTVFHNIAAIDKPEDILELANIIAKSIKQPPNTVSINFIKEF